MSLKTKRTTRRASRRPPASGRKPTYRFSARDVMMTADELQTFHREFQPLCNSARAAALVVAVPVWAIVEPRTQDD